MNQPQLDAFILYNEKEREAVAKAVAGLEQSGISTYFWRRDVPVGANWKDFEEERLRVAETILVFLGEHGWGRYHLSLAEKAQTMGKRIIPVLIGEPPPDAMSGANGLFLNLRYLNLWNEPDALPQLITAIREPSREAPRELSPEPDAEPESGPARQFDGIVADLVDGNEEQRSRVLELIITSRSLDRAGLARRLAFEVQERFSPGIENHFYKAIRDPKLISSIRSWMLSCLIWSDLTHAFGDLLRRHVNPELEPDRNVRYWTLAGLFQTRVPYLQDVLAVSQKDPAPEVSALARAILSPQQAAESFKSPLTSGSFEVAWPALRVLRVVPLPEVAQDVCAILNSTPVGSSFAYDALYALANPVMARTAAPLLSERPGPEATVSRVIAECRGSNTNAIRNFAHLLAVLDASAVERALAAARQDSETESIATDLARFVKELRRKPGIVELSVPGYTADVIDVLDDPLDIEEDVQTLTAVVMARKVTPPLAVGLFGDWGTGKSYFMQSVKTAADELAKRAKETGDNTFCTHIVPIEFNAWHYADTHLLASLVNHILEKLSTYVSPQPNAEQRHADLLKERADAQLEASNAESEIAQTEQKIQQHQGDLQALQTARETQEIGVLDLKTADLTALFKEDPQLKEEINSALRATGFDDAVASVASLSAAAAEANSVREWLLSLWTGKNRAVMGVLLIVVLVVIPGVTQLLRSVTNSEFFGLVSAAVAEFAALAAGVAAALRNTAQKVRERLTPLEKARRKVEKMLEQKRTTPSAKEKELQQTVASLQEEKKIAAQKMVEATERLARLEKEILQLEEGRSLARFLSERTRSEDYRKHLGVMSVIRQDFETLGERLTTAAKSPGAAFRPVDRIILYIDDLDRCPADKVLEVLEAVHLLLAYPLFVVIVGVDPRWLLNSLSDTYPAFQSNSRKSDGSPGRWTITPQNYLEKIFQIPFTLRPMTDTGYQNLMDRLLAPTKETNEPASRTSGSPPTDGTSPPTNVGNGGSTPALEPQGPGASEVPSPPRREQQERSAPKSQQGQQIEQKQVEQPKANVRKRESRFIVQREALVIRDWEADFAKRLFTLMPTPRAAKRFSNIYRMLKAPVGRERLLAFEGTPQHPGEFQLPMLLLALSIGLPAEAAALFPELRRQGGKGAGLAEAMRRIAADGKAVGSLAAVEERIGSLLRDPRFPNSADALAEWVPRVARFSFDLGWSGSMEAARRSGL